MVTACRRHGPAATITTKSCTNDLCRATVSDGERRPDYRAGARHRLPQALYVLTVPSPVRPTAAAGVTLDLGGHATFGTSLSGVTAVGDTLVLAPDEGAVLLTLRRGGDGPEAQRSGARPSSWGPATAIPLDTVVDLPGAPDDEVDAEGLDAVDGHLWVTGSHSAKRKRVKPGTPAAQVPARLARVNPEKARRLLARIPLVGGATLAPRETTVQGASPAARLPSGRRGLLGALVGDEHLGPFLGIPGKDNGFDIEGIAVVPSGVLLGLRGPVLRGWAVLLDLDVTVSGDDPTELALRGVRKHFLDLDGLGVRDLARDGDDLLVLAGPTMALDGPSRILSLPAGAREPLPPAVARDELERVAELAVGEGCDHPEGLTVLPEGLLVLHDSPAPDRLGTTTLLVDLLPR